LKKIHPAFLSLLSGLLLWLSWPVSPFTFLIFLAFVPLLWMEKQGISRSHFFLWVYIAMLCWNLGTTWWVCNASLVGGFLAIFINPLLMCIPWMGFYGMRRRKGRWPCYLSLVIFWLCFEYIHLNWQLSWPWLTLGNAMATHPAWVQWYSYTGVGGGSLWIWAVNLSVFFLLRKWTGGGRFQGISWIRPLLILGLPLILSYWSFTTSPGNPSQTGKNIVVIQPNIDPYEKFVAGNQAAELQKLIRLSESRIDSRTALVVWPETAISVPINEDSMRQSHFLAPVWDFLKRNPQLNLLTGVEGFRLLTADKKDAYSEKIPGTLLYEDDYNSAVLMDGSRFQAYHKSKLVPGVETLPWYLHFLAALFEKFGGTTGSYARQDERTVLTFANGSYAIAPAVCYESIYGEMMAAYVQKGATLLVIITNDGWWGDTPGYRQHENYARLRAIETRRWIARSANTGISCFIDPQGRVWEPQPWDRETAIQRAIPAEQALTFYVRWGDLILEASALATIGLLAWAVVVAFKRPRKIG
jgi:apolipoprotein N-acyltransferase